MGVQERTRNSSSFVTTISWLLIVISILVTVVAVAQYVAYWQLVTRLEQIPGAKPVDTRATITHVMALARIALGSALLACAVGLLKRRRWARHGVLALASAGVVGSVYRLAVTWSSTSAVPPPEDAAAGELWIIRIGSFLSYAYPTAACLFLGWIVVKLMSRSVREEFSRRSEPS